MNKRNRGAGRLAAALWMVGLAATARAEANLAPCWLDGLPQRALCGRLQRPLDPQRADGVQISLHYAVLPALARHKKPDPVFFFAGGPGQSAIDFAGALSRQYARLLNRRDLVLIDQRGTGRSAPLKCPEDDPRASAPPLAEQLDPERAVARLAACRQALQALPHGDLRHYSTPVAMADADAVRQALGAERINLVGASYGTRAVLDYQRQFPQRVRRAVIDGVAPPDMRLAASFSTDNQAALDALLAWCETDAACRGRHPGLRGTWQALLQSLPRTLEVADPMTGQGTTVTITRAAVLDRVRSALFLPLPASALPAALAQAAQGRFEALLALPSLVGGGAGPRLASGMHFSVVCSEDAQSPAPPSAPGADFGDLLQRQYERICADWPRATLPPAFYTVPPAPAPVLVLSGAIDPATPPRHGQRVAQALGPLARHVVVPNTGHGALALACLHDAATRFIDADTAEQAQQVPLDCAQALPRPGVAQPLRRPEARP